MAASTNPGLRQPFDLDPSIKLVNNYIVGCTTYHVPYSTDDLILSTMEDRVPGSPDPMLVMDNRISELCLECHRKWGAVPPVIARDQAMMR
jgi:hypothetical protein